MKNQLFHTFLVSELGKQVGGNPQNNMTRNLEGQQEWSPIVPILFYRTIDIKIMHLNKIYTTHSIKELVVSLC